MTRKEIPAIIDRIVAGTHTEDDIIALRTAVSISGDGNTVQLGDRNIIIKKGRDIHIGDRIYKGADAEKINTVLFEIEKIVEFFLKKTQPPQINWRKVCQEAWEQKKKLTTNPLTGDNRVLDDVYVPLGLVTRKAKAELKEETSPQTGSNLYHPERDNHKEDKEELEDEHKVTRKFSKEEFFQKVLQQGKSPTSKGRRLAIIGEPGAGKTTLLQKIADWVFTDTEQDVAIWVSLGDLQGKTLDEYLGTTWLKNRLPVLLEEDLEGYHRKPLEELLKTGRVWLLLDGVDEIGVAKPVYNIAEQIQNGLLAKARIVLTCRQNVWDLDKKALDDFDVYCNLDFEPKQVQQFINTWFTSQSELGESLCTKLNEDGKERIRDLVRNPLRLTLLCFIWGKDGKAGELPNTKAGLYENFTEKFYQWKNENEYFQTTEEITEKTLNQKLGELAKRAIDEENSPFKLRASLVHKVLGEKETSLFQLVKRIGWLNIVGNENKENIYAFFHPSFQEYFAALAVNDWRFFLNHDNENPNPTVDPNPFLLDYNDGKPSYRFFEPKWNEVIQLWFGSNDIENEEKKQLINKLSGFQDGCYTSYVFRGLPLLAAGVNEFSNYLHSRNNKQYCKWIDEFTEELVKTLVALDFGSFDEKEQCWVIKFTYIFRGVGKAALQEMDRTKAIKALIPILESDLADDWIQLCTLEFILQIDPENQILPKADYDLDNYNSIEVIIKCLQSEEYKQDDYDFIYESCLDCLLKIKPVGNKKVINYLIKLLKKYEQDKNISYIYRLFECFEEICVNDSDAIKAILDVFFNLEIKDIYWLKKILEKIALGNQEAIITLLEWIRHYLLENHDESKNYDKYRHYPQAIDILSKIADGNEEAMKIVISWLNNSNYNQKLHLGAINLLGNIGDENINHILLDEIHKYNHDKNILNTAIVSLTKIGLGNQEETTSLVQLFNQSETDDTTRIKIVNYIKKFGMKIQEFVSNNQDVINIFFDTLRKPETDKRLRTAVFECLEKIIPENEETDNALVSLLTNTEADKDVRRYAVNLLRKRKREKTSVNSQAINQMMSWFSHLEIEQNERRNIANLLGKFAVGNGEVITQLVQLLLNDEIERQTRNLITGLLEKVDPDREVAINFLVSQL